MVSTLSGPIPPHPYYDKSDQSLYVECAVPRVRPEAKNIAEHAQGKVGLLLVQGSRISAPIRTKPQPKDHLKENVRRMRRIQRQTKQKDADVEIQKPTPVKALWKSSKYEGVQSKVSENLQKDPDEPRPFSCNFLRAHSRTGWSALPSSRPSSPTCSESSIPKAESAREVKFIRRDIDFVKANGRAVKHVNTMKRSPSMTALDDLRKKMEQAEIDYQRGEVPKYLQTRKNEWAAEEEERIANIPDPDMPPGHRLMPDDDRRQTLQKLNNTEKELLSQLHSMPIRSDTIRVRTHKEELERKLAEIDEAKKIFSRPKVFVRLDQ